MKKIISFILTLLVLPCSLILVGCADQSYKLSNLQSDIDTMIAEYEIVVEKGEGFTIDYSYFRDGTDKYVENIINNIQPYTSLKDYHFVLNNLMTFANDYIDECCNEDVKVDGWLRDRLKDNLDDVSMDLSALENSTRTWAGVVKDVYKLQDISQEASCLDRFKTVLDDYADLCESVSNFADSISRIYFDYVLVDSNVNFYGISYEDFNLNMLINKLDARIKNYVSASSQLFVERNVLTSTLSTNITTAPFTTISLNADNYLTNMNLYNSKADFDNNLALQLGANNKAELYDLAIRLYNVQTVYNDNIDKYITARNDINFIEVNADSDCTNYERVCRDNILNHISLMNEYNTILQQILTKIGV